MKLKNIILPIVAVLMVSSCDFLDKMPDDQKTMDMVWKSRKETEAYLYSVYSQLPIEHSIWGDAPWVGASDECDMIWERYLTASMNVGNWGPNNLEWASGRTIIKPSVLHLYLRIMWIFARN
ncbi:MAG: hypothetical protein V8Q76_12125 [Bacteroides intestinalis]